MQEYSSVSVYASEHAKLPERLNASALEGWSLVSIVSTGSEIVAYLSRAKSASTPAINVISTGNVTPTVNTSSSASVSPTPTPASEQNGWAAVGSTTVTTTTPSVPADWYKDPAGRYEYRYWDGTKWTEHVSRGGVKFTDPPTP
jgi:hypothetical protein